MTERRSLKRCGPSWQTGPAAGAKRVPRSKSSASRSNQHSYPILFLQALTGSPRSSMPVPIKHHDVWMVAFAQLG